MRVVSWNIRLGIEVGRAIDALTTHPNLQDADVILLQEMDDVGPVQIADALGLESVYEAGCMVKGTDKPFGNAVLARGSVGDSVAVSLPYPGRVLGLRSRIAVQSAVTVEPMSGGSSMDLMVWSVHAEIPTLPHRLQRAQYQTVADCAAGFAGTHTLAGGDFNTASRRSVRALVESMEGAGMHRLLADGQKTFSRFGRSFELDHLFASGFTSVDSGVVRGHGASDHDPVWAVLDPIDP